MKRSEVNENMRLARDVFEAHRLHLPKWAFWSPENWKHCGPEVREIKTCMLGWHVTDFGLDDFANRGIVQFTLRNGPARRRSRGPLEQPIPAKPYAEKVLFLQNRQTMPLCLHRHRTRDLIHRGGGDLLVRVHLSTPAETPDMASRIPTSINGISYNLKAGGVVRLAPGDSMTLPPRRFCAFWAEKAGVVIGEIGTACDDLEDHRFQDKMAWFPPIEEDEAALYLLSNEYPDSD